jgi:acetyltransferase-like isoleucine patch superfamily enzyme
VQEASRVADVVIFGSGPIALTLKVYFETHAADRLVGFTVDRRFCTDAHFADLPLVPWEELEEQFPPDRVKLLGPLSYRGLNDFRRERHLEGKARGYQFASFIHPHSHIYTKEIGENCIILENNVIQPFVKIGSGVIIWSGNHLGHHAIIGDHCFIASQVGLGGMARLGDCCFLAGKVGVESGVEIGQQSFLGTGVIIKDNLPPKSVVPGKGDQAADYSSDRIKRLHFR